MPIVGLLLLGGLLAVAGRSRDRGQVAILAAIAVIAAAGFALLLLPPAPVVIGLVDLLVAGAAMGCALRLSGSAGPVVARVGVVALATAVAIAAIGRTVSLVDLPPGPGVLFAVPLAAAGQVAFVVGAAMVGIGGLAGARDGARVPRRPFILGIITGVAALVSAVFAPAAFGAVMIWSIGLAGAVSPAVVAVAAGLLVAGAPLLNRDAPTLTLGAVVVMLAGYGLASSGLLLASLLGLVVAGTRAEILSGAPCLVRRSIGAEG